MDFRKRIENIEKMVGKDGLPCPPPYLDVQAINPDGSMGKVFRIDFKIDNPTLNNDERRKT
ncbi:MAG: hypothetical protein JW913_19665 [Chitinispirillaceae bacterium]|nr:hypothetical protein [Chitinispirillaceae bacterium]